jgi:serine protease Do
MRFNRTLGGFLLAAALAGGATLFYANTAHVAASPPDSGPPEISQQVRKIPPAKLAEGRQVLDAFSIAFQDAASRVNPSVVQVYTEATADTEFVGPHGSPFDDELLRRFFGFVPEGRMPESRRIRGSGSGVIVAADGYILTNNHVVDDADKVTVVLGGKKRYDAEVVGTDPQTDLAVIKVDAHDLPAADLGDSDAVKVGQWVIAVGNPFNLEHTVTSGIVSATGRASIGLANFESFIQTDASINPGNSGGALADLDGRVVGINTAISSPSGGNVGIGFAIPINMARDVMQQLIDTGQVARGYMGLVPQDIDETMAHALRLGSTDGVLVGDVTAGGAADRAGIRRGDVLRSLDGRAVASSAALRNEVAALRPGSKVDVEVLRDGRPHELTVKLAERPSDEQASNRRHRRSNEPEAEAKLGLSVRPLTPELAKELHVESDGGVVVEQVMPGTPASDSGLRRGDVIKELNGRPVDSPEELRDAVSRMHPGDDLALWVRRGEVGFFAAIELAA